MLAAFCGHVHAQPAAPAGDTALTLGQVVVSGTADGPLEARRVLSSVDILPTERIERQVVNNNWELFGQVPGVMLTQFGQGTTSGKFSMRAFNGEGEINAVKLLIDGVPSNSNDGNMPYIDLAPRLDIESIEVVRGTNDPRYGLHNIAGNANILTRSGGNYLLGRATVGSFATRELQAAAGIEKDGLAQNYAVSLQRTDGYRDHANAENGSFSGKWFFTPSGGTSRFGLIARHYTATADEAGYLTRAQARANPDQSPAHNATDEDRRQVSQFALQGESELAERLFWTGQLYLNNLDDRRFVKFSAGASQQERLVAETHTGATTTLTWRAGKTVIGDVSVMGGVDVEHQDNRSQRYNTLSQVRQTQTRNQQFEFDTTGAFVQAVIKPLAGLTLTPAFRADRVTGSYTNQLNGRVYDVNDYGTIKQPKFSAVYALSDAASVYGNWGRSFQVGVGTASY
ncbi:MAG: TonB-dependent receptor, partial [Zoogloea sp.]|nr:TonB-dependent receptor [Zoogloea sp.]